MRAVQPWGALLTLSSFIRKAKPAHDDSLNMCSSMICDVVGILITLMQLGQIVPQHYEMVRFLVLHTTRSISLCAFFFSQAQMANLVCLFFVR